MYNEKILPLKNKIDCQILTSCNLYIGSNVSGYIGMVCDTLKNSIPKAVVYCQVLSAKRSLLNQFYAHVGRQEVKYFNFMYFTEINHRRESDGLHVTCL